MKTGQPIDSYIPDQDLCDLVMEISQGKHVDYEDIPDYEFSIAKEKFLLARGQPVLGERKECLGAVINVVDISSMKILDQLKSEIGNPGYDGRSHRSRPTDTGARQGKDQRVDCTYR